MRRVTLSFALVVFALVLVSAGISQQASVTTVPNLVRYEGTLRDAQSAPLSSSAVGVTFAIYRQQDGGAPVWMETQSVTLDAGGNYGVLLGSTTAAGLPADLFSQQEQRWLGVQVQGQSEEPRVLLVSVPYAFKAHEAETLGGRSASDFVLAGGANSTANGSTAGQSLSIPANNSLAIKPGINKGAASDGPTNFSGSTTDQIVGVTQSGSGVGVNASAPSKGVVGTATSTSGTVIGVEGGSAGSGGYGVYGNVSSSTGATVGVKGNSTSTAGTGVRGTNTAASGATTGVSGYVASAAGTAGAFNNAAGGKILSGQNNGVETFSVDGLGNVNSVAGTYQIAGGSVVSIGTPTDYNLFLGARAGSHNVAGSGQLNTFSGYAAGLFNTTGSSNTFSGFQAGLFNTTGNDNAFYGYEAGINNTTGLYNTFSGYAAGGNNTTASYNTFSGFSAGLANNGTYNAFFGYAAGLDNTSGGSDAFYGAFAGFNNTTACCNVFTGYKSGYSNTTGGFNVFSGWKAGYSNTGGQYNVFDGYQAGYSNALGQNNVFVGYQAGYNNTGDDMGHGQSNAFFGYQAGYSNNSGTGNAFAGYQAGFSNTGGGGNAFFGGDAGDMNTYGSGNTFIGSGAGQNNTVGNNNIYIADGGPFSGSESNTIRIASDRSVTAAYIGGIYGSTSSSGIPVYVNSNGQLGTQTSSLRFKEQIADMGDSTGALMKLRPVTFLYKPEYSKGDRTLQYGLIAEEVAQVYPELVAYDKDGQPYTVRYQYLTPMLLNEAQKQYRRAEAQAEVIKTQEQKIDSQQRQIEEMQQRLSRLESLIGARVNTAQLDPEHHAISDRGAQ